VTARYTVHRADCAGSVDLAETDSLQEAAWLRKGLEDARNGLRGVIFFVTDSERDGVVVNDERLEEAMDEREIQEQIQTGDPEAMTEPELVRAVRCGRRSSFCEPGRRRFRWWMDDERRAGLAGRLR
jgi:hypothetical protein